MGQRRLWRRRRLCSLVPVLFAVAFVVCTGCTVPTPTGSPTPSLEPSSTPTGTASSTPVPTHTATSTVTTEPTRTPTATTGVPACPPPLMGDVTLSCWIDANDDRLRDPAEEPMSCTILLRYSGLLPELYQEFSMFSLSTGPVGIWAGVLPAGTYSALLLAYEEGKEVVPWHNRPEWLNVSVGDNVNLPVPFWHYAYPTTTPTADPCPGCVRPTPTPTASPTMTAVPLHQCPNYWVACVDMATSCPANTHLDPSGVCGAGFKCCVP